MSKEENIELLRRAKAGDASAKDTLIERNMGLCKSIAARFLGRGAEYEDLTQIAAIGMIKAVNSFDFSYNTAFSTYAVPLIVGEIRRFLRDDGAIKVSRSTKKIGNDAMHKREEFINSHGREPKISELAELCGVGEEELVYSLEAISPISSLSDPIGSDDNGACIEDTVSDRDDRIGKAEDRIALAEAIRNLPQEQRELIYLRYFKEMSQQKTGQILGMTQVKVSREEKRIIEILRKAL